jgi:hypothetical protein
LDRLRHRKLFGKHGEKLINVSKATLESDLFVQQGYVVAKFSTPLIDLA